MLNKNVVLLDMTGSEIVPIGTPEEIAKVKNSHTGKYLKNYLKN